MLYNGWYSIWIWWIVILVLRLANATSGLLFNDLSNHKPIFVVDVDEALFEGQPNQLVLYRDKNPTDMTNFSDQLGSVDWSVVEGLPIYTTFHAKLKEIYNGRFPLGKKKIERRQICSPGLTIGLLKSIKRKNILYTQYVSNSTYNRERFYKSYRNRFNRSLRLAKRLYYNKTLEKSKSNLKWTVYLYMSLVCRFAKT